MVLFFFWPHGGTREILVAQPGIEPGPSAMRGGILTTGLPGSFHKWPTFLAATLQP